MLYLLTHEPKAVDLGLVPRQVIFRHLGLVGTGTNPKAMKEAFERAPGLWATPSSRLQKRVVRYIWMQAHQIFQW